MELIYIDANDFLDGVKPDWAGGHGGVEAVES